jgi:hypothetical protein
MTIALSRCVRSRGSPHRFPVAGDRSFSPRGGSLARRNCSSAGAPRYGHRGPSGKPSAPLLPTIWIRPPVLARIFEGDGRAAAAPSSPGVNLRDLSRWIASGHRRCPRKSATGRGETDMATTETRPGADVRPWRLIPPSQDELSQASAEIAYSPTLDSVFVYFYGRDRPAVSLVLENHLTALLDPETDQMIGLEIDHFLSEAVLANPVLEPLLELPGMPARRVREIRRQLDPASRSKATIGSLVESIARQGSPDPGWQAALPLQF